MNKLYPLTQEEQDYAEENYWLISDFLAFHNLPEADWFDVVVFGYLTAVQCQCRKPCSPERQNFPAFARLNMRYAVSREIKDNSRDKRKANQNALSMETPLAGDEEFTFHEILADKSKTPEMQVVECETCNDILSVGTESEQAVMKLISLEFTGPEICSILGLTIRQVWRKTKNFRTKAARADAGLELVTATALESRNYRKSRHEAILARERERWNRRKDRRNAQRRAKAAEKRAAKKAALDSASIESGMA